MTAVTDPTSITISWQPPRIPSGAIIRYDISIFNSSGLHNFDVSGSNLAFTVTGLSPFTNHTFEVVAVNAIGQGEEASLTTRTDEDGMFLKVYF